MRFLIFFFLISFKVHAEDPEKWAAEQGTFAENPTETTTINGKSINFAEDFGLSDLRTKNPDQFAHYQRYQSSDTAHLESESKRVKKESYKEEEDKTRNSLYAEDPLKIARKSFEDSSAYMGMIDEPFMTRHDREADNPEAEFSKYYGDCEEKVVRTKRQTLLKEIQRCEESKPAEKRYCVRFLKETKKYEKKKVYWRTKYSGFESNYYTYYQVHAAPAQEFWRKWHDGCCAKDHKCQNEYHFQKREVKVGLRGGLSHGPWMNISEGEYNDLSEGPIGEPVWEDNCTSLKEAVARGECRKISSTCQGGKLRTEEGQTFERDCWQYEDTYECGFPSANSCQTLREEGCEQASATCKHKVGDICYVWDKTYHCPKKGEEEVEGRVLICGEGMPVCLEGECEESNYLPNQNFMHAVSRLEALKSMSNHLEGDPLTIFKGEGHQCKINMLNFRDCCGNGGGWGVSVNLAGCEGSEKTLGEKRKKGLCISAGSYCAEKIPLLGCITKKHRYCCFPTKLIRIIQEQGRAQLKAKGVGGLEWEGGNCRGLTPEEMSQVDFSKIDLSEALDEMLKTFEAGKAKADISVQMTKITSDVGRDLAKGPDEKKALRLKTTRITREGFNPKETM